MTGQRGRPRRQEQVRQERRRRDDTTLDGGQALKLAIPADIQQKLAEQGRVGRWFNDEGNNIYRRTELDDWDKVEGVDSRPVKTDKNGTVAQAILLSKPKAFIDEDRRKKDAKRLQTEQAMLSGAVPSTGDTPATSLPDNFYADKANKIERANKLIE